MAQGTLRRFLIMKSLLAMELVSRLKGPWDLELTALRLT